LVVGYKHKINIYRLHKGKCTRYGLQPSFDQGGKWKVAILEKEVWIGFNSKTVRHYRNKGYNPRIGTEILVKIDDLTDSCSALLTKICDICGLTKPQPHYNILKCRNNSIDKLDRCRTCASREAGIQSGIANETNCVATTHPWFSKMFWNKEDAYKFTYGSTKRVDFKCPNCGRKIKNRVINKAFRGEFPCFCSDGMSYPEKFMYNILKQLNVKFIKELTSENFNGCKKYRYDFFLNNLNTIIETHGEQHYIESARGRSLKEEQENDKAKEKLALENGIKEYIVIDCRNSEMEWIKNNIIKSKLSEMFDLSKVDWKKAHEFALNTLVKEVSDLWNEGTESPSEIGEILNLSRSTVHNYLKKGTKIGWCNYDPKQQMIKAGKTAGTKMAKKLSKKVVQLSLNGDYIHTWQSISEAQNKLNITGIYKSCKRIHSHIGGYIWLYLEDYNKLDKTEKEKLITNRKFQLKKEVVQLGLDGNYIKTWETISNATKSLGISPSFISSVCMRRQKSASGFMWMYKDDYEKTKENLNPYKKETRSKPIIQLSLKGDYIREWKSATEVNEKLGVSNKHISSVCNGNRKSTEGYRWMFKDEYEKNSKTIESYSKKTTAIPIVQLSLGGELIQDWRSATEASKILTYSQSGLSQACRERKIAYGFKWMYKEDYEKYISESVV
jgi:predicted transcriptional regulator